jgi:hypothetical protein
MEPLPESAGVALLKWQRGDFPPRMTGHIITLPKDNLIELHALKSGEQYLGRFRGESKYLFFGTDEGSFVTELNHAAFRSFQEGGENAFFSSLMPDIVKDYVALGKIAYQRQGEFWTCEIASSWNEVLSPLTLITRTSPLGNPQNARNLQLLGSRHLLTGKIMYFQRIRQVMQRSGKATKHTVKADNFVLISGIVEAPDHTPLVLPGVNVLAENMNLRRDPATRRRRGLD